MVLELRFPTSRVKERTPFPEHHLLVWPGQQPVCEPPGGNHWETCLEGREAVSLGRWLPLVNKSKNCIIFLQCSQQLPK